MSPVPVAVAVSRARRHPLRRVAGWHGRATLLLFLLAAAVIGAVTVAGFDAPWVGDRPTASFRDFRDATYHPVRDLLGGHNPYDVPAYLARNPVEQEFPAYAPHHLLLHLPFGLLPYDLARLAFLAVQVALVPVLAWTAMRATAVTGRLALGLAAVLLLSYPGAVNAYYGQTTLEVAIGAYLALRPPGGRPWLAALGVVLALQKPQLGVPLCLLLVAAGRGRPVLAGIGAAVGLSTLVSIPLAVAAGGPAPLVASVLDGLQTTAAAGANDLGTGELARIDAAAVVARSTGVGLPTTAQAAIGLAVLAVAAALIRVARRAAPDRPDLVVATVCLGALLAGPNLPYSALVAVVPLALVGTTAWSATPRVLLGTVVLVPMVTVAAITAVLQVTDGTWIAPSVAGTLIGASCGLAALVVGGEVIGAARRTTAAPAGGTGR